MADTLQLTEEEKRMLGGAFGRAKQAALQFIVDYAKALGAERLCKISKAQIFIGAHPYLELGENDDIDAVISRMYLNVQDTIKIDEFGCFTQTDATPIDPVRWKEIGISRDRYERDCAYRKRFVDAGASDCGTCTSYLTGFLPTKGEHYVSTESHALLLMNSLWGARANADSIEASICSSICGRTPYWGMHITEKRAGTHLFRVMTNPETVLDWDLLGLAIGEKLPLNAVPVLVGDFDRPDIERLKSCFAAMATTGGPEMCHIIGVTLEANTLEEAFQGHRPQGEIVISDSDLEAAHRTVSSPETGPVSFVSLGCPHYTLSQIRDTALQLRNRRIHTDVTFRVWTAAPIRQAAVQSGYAEIIENAGGMLLTSTCPLVSETVPKTEGLVFDSCKQAKYIGLTSPQRIHVGSQAACLRAALTGQWDGRWQ